MVKRGIFSMAMVSASLLMVPSLSHAQQIETGGKLLLTRGISTFEGSGGGGLTPWALITGNETNRGIGGSAHYTHVMLSDYQLRTYGAAAGFYDRFELSYTRQDFDTQDIGTALGLGEGYTFSVDVVGAKVRLAGNAVLDQDTWMPQVALGVQYKKSNRGDLVAALGATNDEGVDVYVSATKLILSQSLLVNATLRYTKAHQTGILGFGDKASLQPEFSVGYLVTKRLLVGAEYRFKPNKLAFAKEDDWMDIFAAYAINPYATVTLAYGMVGDVATIANQKGLYATVQLGF